ncbi:DUF1643 domain-containing protein [[Clostridium] hylemonae]|uniref:DUF1643 domain-containing protein n=1 Tax=[Clostridium] hylemonae TaxID=89153 RepID=UPI001106D337|nr:DUF1643 domain-containing protein [[Clostridium] hylemonae]
MDKVKPVNRRLEIRTKSGEYSCRDKNRERLSVYWESDFDGKAVAIGINPSKANDKRSDNTLTKLGRFLDAFGFDEFLMLNIFESYAPHQPDINKKAKTNFEKYKQEFEDAKAIFVVWGVKQNDYLTEKEAVLTLLEEYKNKLFCLQTPSGNKPAHPSRIDYASYKVTSFY